MKKGGKPFLPQKQISARFRGKIKKKDTQFQTITNQR
jgi:hypothetical protein